jgi:hypothetical protein
MKKKLVAVAATVGMALGMTVLTAPAASAGGCIGDRCGGVKNRTGKLMHYAVNIGYGPSKCDVWNWNDGTTPAFKAADCTQTPLYGGTAGGNRRYPLTDVDAYTFNYQGYHERYGRLGTWHWRQKGVWTKFRTTEIADCGIGANNEIWCTTLVQAP